MGVFGSKHLLWSIIMPKWNIIAFFPPPLLSIETGVFVTAIDHSNVIFCLCLIWEKRSRLWSQWGRELLSQSCALEAAGQTGNFKDGATRFFVFQHLCLCELGDLCGTPTTTEKCKWCLLGKKIAADQDLVLWKRKPWLAEWCTLMKLRWIIWLKDSLLIWGGARQTALQRAALRLAFKQRAQEEERKNHPQDPPPPPAPQPRGKTSPGKRVIRQLRQRKHWAHFWDCCKGWQFIACFNDTVCDMHTRQLGTGVRSMSYFT